jgi:hypothetical protein
MTCYWRKEQNQCSEDLVKAGIQVKMNCGLSCKDLYLFVLQNKDILKAEQSSAQYSFKKQHQQAVRREEGRGGITMIFYTT